MNNFDIKKLIADAPSGMLTATETNLLKEYSFFGNIEGKNIWPSIGTLVQQTKLSKSTIVRNTKSLLSKGFLKETFRPKRGSWAPVCYEIDIPFLEKVSVSNQQKQPEKLYINQCHDETAYKHRSVMVTPSSVIDENIQCHSDTQSTNRTTNELPIEKEKENKEKEKGLEPIQKVVEKPTLPKQEKSLAPKQNKKDSIDKDTMEKILIVFNFWKETFNHPRCFLNDADKRHILNSLKWGYSVDELKQAIMGMSKTPHNMGENQNKQIYDAIHIVFKSPLQIDRFIRTGTVKITKPDPDLEIMKRMLRGCI